MTSAADRVAVLTAMKAGLDEQLTQAKAEVIAESDQVEADRFRTSGFGPVNVVHPDPKPFVLNEAALFAWVEEHHPEQIKRSVQPAFIKALLDRLEVLPDGGWVDPETGECPEWVGIHTADPYVSWPTGKEQKALKAEAKAWFATKADAILGALRAITSDAA